MNITQQINSMREYFESGALGLLERRAALIGLEEALRAHEGEIIEALKSDLGKPSFEAYATEIGIVYSEIRYALKHLKAWTKVQRVRTPLFMFPSKSRIYPSPYGVVLIMSPWNYPFMLTLTPLVSALAAGNCAVVKPSRYSKYTSEVIGQILTEAFEPSMVKVYQGGADINTQLLAERFDYIFFTGSVNVGKVVMTAAAKYLTPITLELGGKSPCIIDDESMLSAAAKRVTWGKFINAGQTCIAPDYVLIRKGLKDTFVEQVKAYIKEFYGEEPIKNIGKIINEKHFARLSALLTGGRILAGGDKDEKEQRIAPTILDNVTFDSLVMAEEIFGPILPIIEYENLDEAVAAIKSRPHPLACYLFTANKPVREKLLHTLHFGGGCVNDTLMHISNPRLAFGGVGESGMGAYHGKRGFDTFTHYKSVVISGKRDLPFKYPPYTDSKEKAVRKFL